MNKMLTVNTLALGNLKRRRKQYTIMIIGIIFAMVLSTSVPLLLLSATETRHAEDLNNYGAQDAIVSIPDAGAEFYDQAIRDGYLEGYGLAHIIGYACSAEGEQRLGASVAWLDDDAKLLSNQTFIEGSYPVSDSDIAIERNALTRLGYKDPKIGDTITLLLDPQSGEEYLETVEKQYTLCGIVRSKKNFIDQYFGTVSGEWDTTVPAMFVRQGADTEPGGKEKLTAYVKEVPKKYKGSEEYYIGGEPQSFHGYLSSLDFDEQSGRYRDQFNYKYIHVSYSPSWLTSADELMRGGDMMLLVLLALIFAACVAIVNSFNNDLKGRKKQIGMLRAVGATRRQIIEIFGREALYISLICVPVSILVSYIAVKLALGIINSEAVMTKSLIALPLCALLDILVVMGAAMVPLFYASRITPVQAIRNIENNRKIRTKHIHTQKIFDPARHLARRDMTFYKGSRITVAAILALTIIISCVGFSSLAYNRDHLYKAGFDYYLFGMSGKYMNDYFNIPDTVSGLTETERNEITSDPYISSTSGIKGVQAVIKLDEMSDYFFILSADVHSYFDILYNMDPTADDFPDIKRRTLEYDENDEYTVKIKQALGAENCIFGIPVVSYDREDIIGQFPGVDLDRIDSGEDIILLAPSDVKWAVSSFGEKGYNSHVIYDDEPGSRERSHVIAEAPRDIKAGDTLDLVIADLNVEYHDEYNIEILKKEERTVNIAAVSSQEEMDDYISGRFAHNAAQIITTHEGLSRLYGNVNYTTLYINADPDIEIDARTDAELMEKLRHYSDKYDGWTNSVYEIRQNQIKSNKTNMLTLLAMMIIGFAICASIINNALSAKIRESKSVIGTMRAVGASERDLVRGYIWQMITMFGIGAGIGYAIFMILYFIVVPLMTKYNGFNQFPMYFRPWISIGMTAALLVVCGVNLWLRVREEMKHSIVENIREL